MIDNINAGDIVSVKPINEIIDTVNSLAGDEQPAYQSINSDIYDSAVIMPDKQLADRFKNNWQKTGILSADVQYAQKSIEIQKVKYELYISADTMQDFYANTAQLLNFNDLSNKNDSFLSAWQDGHRYDVLVRDIISNDNDDSSQLSCAVLKYADKDLFGGSGPKTPEVFDIDKYAENDTPMFKIKNCVFRLGRAYDFSYAGDTFDLSAENGIIGYCLTITTADIDLNVDYYSEADYRNTSISAHYQPLYKTNALGEILLDYRRLLGVQSYDNTTWGII